MKKSEKIFQDTWYECWDHAKAWGKEYNPDGRAIGYGSLITEEVVCTRTLNDVQKCIDRRRRELDLNERYGISDSETLALRRYTLEMVQVTLDNNRKNLEKFYASLKS